jgi:hypothetical protein
MFDLSPFWASYSSAMDGATEASSATGLIETAAAAFAAAAKRENVEINAIIGLRDVLRAAARSDVVHAQQPAISALMHAIQDAGTVLAEQVAGRISNDRHVSGMVAALGLASLFGKKSKAEFPAFVTYPLFLDYVDYAALLLADLESLCLAYRIEARGNFLSDALPTGAVAEPSMQDIDLLSDLRIITMTRH